VIECSKLQTCEMSYSLLAISKRDPCFMYLDILTSFYMAHKNGAP